MDVQTVETDLLKGDYVLAQETFDRYEYGRSQGHAQYCQQVNINERMYLGGGLQWTDEEKQALDGRMPTEVNQIIGAVDSAVGYQIHNRMDIKFVPKGRGADEQKAKLLSKLAMHVNGLERFHWKETQVFTDGLIDQRGYFDIGLKFSDSMQPEVSIETIDPMDVVPDPDANQYDPDCWEDVCVAEWLTMDRIEELYGTEKRKQVSSYNLHDNNWGDSSNVEGRGRFGGKTSGFAYSRDGKKVLRARAVSRQFWKYAIDNVVVFPAGDVKSTNGMSPEMIQQQVDAGGYVTKRMGRKVMWRVATANCLLFNDESPFKHFTVVPYFPRFRRGQTRGMVDNAISPQQILNKATSQALHIINTSANSGWIIEENSLANMRDEELEEKGAETGLILSIKKNSRDPQKIQPNQIPAGMVDLAERAESNLRDVTLSAASQGMQGNEVSGVAIQSRQFASQTQLAVPLDNLARTRHMVAIREMAIFQAYYGAERTYLITEDDPRTGAKVTTPLTINQLVGGGIINDLTVGEYDVEISEQPMQVTFENTQFTQALEMRKEGINVPDTYVVKYSNLADKTEIIQAMEPQGDAERDAKVDLIKAQAEKVRAESVNKSIEGQFSAVNTANELAMNPAIAPLADQMLKSAGFEDKDMAPIIPNARGPIPALDLKQNTNPLTPPNPDAGLNAGIEGGNA